MTAIIKNNAIYINLISNIGEVYNNAKNNVAATINNEILTTYWNIGKYIIEYEQLGNNKAEYGKKLLLNLSKDLTIKFGKGFSRSNLQYMRLLFQYYPICQTLSGKLSWSHYIELLSIGDELSRTFYKQQIEIENWSVRELKRQKKTGLFERLALSKDKNKILELAKKGQIIKSEKDLMRDPYIFEFLDLPENILYSESQLENAIINNLQNFLLEMGKGFAFIGRQRRITLDNRHFFVDLVFYHVILKCYVLIDLKIGKIQYEHIGQMKLYLGYFEQEISLESDNKPIGIILSQEKDDIMVEYAMLNDTSKLIASKYQVYLPEIDELKLRVQEILEK